jgi:hypothetical protein
VTWKAFDQPDVVYLQVQAERAQGTRHFLPQAVLVPVVPVTADPPGFSFADRLVAGVDVLAVRLRRRGDHPEDVVHPKRAIGAFRHPEDDGRSAEGAARLHDDSRDRPASRRRTARSRSARGS